jgi:3-oxoadipate enol-lactonase
MAYQDLGELRLYYQIHNPNALRGAAVTLLHGLGSCGDDWLLQLPALTHDYQVLTLDLRGHGRSSQRSGWPVMEDFTQDVRGLLEALDWYPTHVVGLSLGGAIALQLATDRPDLIRSLTLVNSFARIQVARAGRLRTFGRVALLAFGSMDWMGRWVANTLFPNEDQAQLREVAAVRISENQRSAYVRSMFAVARFDLRSRLNEITAPTLVVAGNLDTTLPIAVKYELVKRIPGARLEVISGSGHATPIDAPEAFNRILLKFLSEVDTLIWQ